MFFSSLNIITLFCNYTSMWAFILASLQWNRFIHFQYSWNLFMTLELPLNSLHQQLIMSAFLGTALPLNKSALPVMGSGTRKYLLFRYASGQASGGKSWCSTFTKPNLSLGNIWECLSLRRGLLGRSQWPMWVVCDYSQIEPTQSMHHVTYDRFSYPGCCCCVRSGLKLNVRVECRSELLDGKGQRWVNAASKQYI